MQNSKAVKAGIGYTVGNYLLKGLTFFTIPIFAKLLSTEDYGIVGTFSSYETILLVLIGLAIHSSFKNARYKYGYVSEGAVPGNDYKTYVSNAYLFILISGLMWFVPAAGLRNVLAGPLKIDPSLVVLLVIYSTANAVIVAFNTDISINYEYKSYLRISFFNAIGNILLSVLLILYVYQAQRYKGRIIGTIIPIAAAAAYVAAKSLIKTRPQNFRSMMRWGLKYSLPIVPHGISQIILSSFDRIMITNMVSAAATGIYSFAYNVFIIIQVTATSLDTVWSPWYYERRNAEDFGAIRKVSGLYIRFLMVISAAVMLMAPEIVWILELGGGKFRESVPCVIPIVAGGFFAFLYYIPASVEYYHEKTNYIAAATSAAAILNILLNYIFIRKYGYIAAAYTTLATYFLYFVFHWFVAKKIEGRALFPTGDVVLSSAVIGAAVVLSAALVNVLWARIALTAGLLAWFLYDEEARFGLLKKALKKIKHQE